MKTILLTVVIVVLGVSPLYSQPGDSVSGRVVKVDGTPMKGVSVMAKPAGTSATDAAIVTQTDSEGQYRFEIVPAGTYDLVAGPDSKAISLRALLLMSIGFDDIFFEPSTGKAGPLTSKITVSPVVLGPAHVTIPGAANVAYDIVVFPSAVKVSGHLADFSGVTLPAQMKATLSGTTSRVATNTDVHSDGAFEFASIPPGEYLLSLVPNLGIVPAAITVGDRDRTGIELGVRSAGVRVRGKILPSDRPEYQDMFPQWVYLIGQDMADLLTSTVALPIGIAVAPDSETPRLLTTPQIVFRDATGAQSEPPFAPVGPDGTFEFLSVPPGIYSMRTLPNMGIANTTIAVKGDKDIADVRAGEGVRVRGEVIPTNSGTRPPELINLKAVQTGSVSSVSAVVNGDGSFEIPKVGPGTYRLLLDGKIRPTPSEITIGNEEAIIRVEAPFNFWVPGHVGFNGPSPSSDKIAEIHVALSSGFESAINPDGSFRLPSNEGAFDFFATNLPEGYVVKSMFYGTENLMDAPVKVESSTPTREIQVTLEYHPGTTP